MSAPDIFLSYNREDVAVAKLYADAFAAAGLEVWWDQTLRSGETYDEVTEAALRGAKAVVVLWSPRSVASHWVRAEATIAHRAKTLVPATIEPCDKPVMFELTQTAELAHWRGDAGDAAWLAFLGDVRRMAGKAAPVTGTLVQNTTRPSISGTMPTVAVLPFTHRGSDDEMEYLAEDLTGDISQELAHRRLFRTIAASTMVAWRGKVADNRTLGQQLDARYLVEGKFQRAGENVRLSVQLIEVDSVSTVWSARYVRTLAELLDSTEAFALEVSRALGDQIAQIEEHRAMSKPAPHSAWDHVVRAIACHRRSGSASVRRALEEARKAVAASPDLGLAHALLAAGLGVPVASQGIILKAGVKREIQKHIELATQLDGDNPEVINWLFSAYSALGEFETNLRLARRLVEIEPNSPVAYFWLGTAHSALGQTAEAISILDKYNALSIADPRRTLAQMMLGMCLVFENRLKEADEAIGRALTNHPDFHMALKWKAIIAAFLGDEARATGAVGRLREVEPDMSLDQHLETMIYTPQLKRLSVEHVATLRRLWEVTEADP